MTAYFFGFFFGRTPLISLSPKKTWEGFLGAFVSTFIFAFVFSGVLAKFPYMTCPLVNLSTNAFSQVSCSPNWVFIPRTIDVGSNALNIIRRFLPSSQFTTISYLPVQLHALVLAAFASLLAPFGGFFASGFKRAFKMKDFADSIPGHGGFTDRMDCQVLFYDLIFQFLMGVFSFIGIGGVSMQSVFDAFSRLDTQDQLELYHKLGVYLGQ